MPFREPGRLLMPLVSWAIIGVIAYGWLAPRSSLAGWQLAAIVMAAVPLAGLAGFGIVAVLGFLVSLPFGLRDRLRRRRFHRFLALLEAGDAPASTEAARRLSARFLEEKEGRFRRELRDAGPLLEAASGPGPLQAECVSIILRHGRDGGDQARALYSGRSAADVERLEDWVRWFSLWAEPGEGDEEDLRPRAYAYALERTEGAARRRVLNRLLTGARPDESWRHVARSLGDELRALDAGGLVPLEREGLAVLLDGSPASP